MFKEECKQTKQHKSKNAGKNNGMYGIKGKNNPSWVERIEWVCPECGTTKMLNPRIAKKRKFCSRQCCIRAMTGTKNLMYGKKRTADTKEKIKQKAIAQWKRQRKNGIASVIMRKAAKTKKENGFIVWNKGLTKETDERVAKYGKLVSVSLKEGYASGRITLHLKRKTNRISKPELAFKNELDRRGLQYIQQKPFCGITIADFYIPSHNWVIYVDGDYWHNLPGAQEKDARQNRILKEHGYQVIRFWEHEINDSVENCFNTLVKYVL